MLFFCGFFISAKIAEKEKNENKSEFYYLSNIYYIFGFLIGILPSFFLNNFALAFIFGILLVQAFIDIKFIELSNRITVFLVFILFYFVVLFEDISRWKSIFISSVICFSIYLFLYLVSRGKAIGGGDVKISFMLGLVGQYNFFQSIMFPLFIYVIYFIFTGFLKRNRKNKSREFFPSMLISIFIMAVFNNM